jgi:hypothetical protein
MAATKFKVDDLVRPTTWMPKILQIAFKKPRKIVKYVPLYSSDYPYRVWGLDMGFKGSELCLAKAPKKSKK